MEINIQNLSFSYGNTPVLSELSLKVSDGQWLGVLGPNGCGKTTLLNCMSGLFTPSLGCVNIDGHSIAKMSKKELAKMIAVVPQTTHIPFDFSVHEIVLMGRSPHISLFDFERPVDLEITRQAMEMTGTWQFRSRSIHELSGGEYQRVIIARALAQEPRVLLLDEPTAFLDIKHETELMRLLARLNKESGITIVSALHNINLATLYCTHISFLKDGSVFKDGEPKDIMTYATIKEVYGTEVYVGINDMTGMPYYTPIKNE